MKCLNFYRATLFLIFISGILSGESSKDQEFLKSIKYNPRKLQNQENINENYIVIYYTEDVKYPNGFVHPDNKYINSRTGISYIEYEGRAYNNYEPISIKANTPVKLFFEGAISNLE